MARQLQDGRVLRIGVPLVDGFWSDYERMQWWAADRISHDTTIARIAYPAPPYVDDVRRGLAARESSFLQGQSVSRNCEMMAAVLLTAGSYARYRAAHGLPPLAALPAARSPE